MRLTSNQDRNSLTSITWNIEKLDNSGFSDGASSIAVSAVDKEGKPDLFSSNFGRSQRRHWSANEDKLLIHAVTSMGEGQWKTIAKIVGTRNHTQCLQRWKKALCPGLRKGQWSKEEDNLLIFQVSKGFRNWGQVATHMPGRTSKQCRERWIHHLDPEIIKSDYTANEDRMIIDLQRHLGNRWSEISRRLKGRTENSVKTRWKMIMRKKTNPINSIIYKEDSVLISQVPFKPALNNDQNTNENGNNRLKPISVAAEKATKMLQRAAPFQHTYPNVYPIYDEPKNFSMRFSPSLTCPQVFLGVNKSPANKGFHEYQNFLGSSNNFHQLNNYDAANFSTRKTFQFPNVHSLNGGDSYYSRMVNFIPDKTEAFMNESHWTNSIPYDEQVNLYGSI